MGPIRHVALIIDASNPYDRAIIEGVTHYIRDKAHWSLYLEEDRWQKLPDMGKWAGHGVIANFDDRKVANALHRLKAPVVGFGGGGGWYKPSSRIPYFLTDQEKVVNLAITHLLERGFRNLAYCGFPNTRINEWSRARGNAFRNQVRAKCIECRTYIGRHRTARNWTELQEHLAAWLTSLPKPVGIVACDDVRARHILEACILAKLDVPNEVAVVGVDNDEMLCELTTPTLSSVQHDNRRIGYEAAQMLDELMAGHQPKRLIHKIDPLGVIARRSTDTLAIDDVDVVNALQYIRENASREIHVPDVADAIHVSRSTLDRKFKTLVGRSARDEIERVRLNQAQRLLSTTDMNLKQIASQAGFRSVAYMTTLFRTRIGHTPADLRKHFR